MAKTATFRRPMNDWQLPGYYHGHDENLALTTYKKIIGLPQEGSLAVQYSYCSKVGECTSRLLKIEGVIAHVLLKMWQRDGRYNDGIMKIYTRMHMQNAAAHAFHHFHHAHNPVLLQVWRQGCHSNWCSCK